MDGSVATPYQAALADFSTPNQPRIRQYLTLLAARSASGPTLTAVVQVLNALRRQVPRARQPVLTADLTQTTPHDIIAFIAAAQTAGLAPSTINTKLGLLTGFFEHLHDEGQMTQQPVRRRHRLLTPTVLPKPIPDPDLAAFFAVIDAVRDRLLFLFMLRCGLRVSEVCARTWDAIDVHAGTVRINCGKGQVDRIVYLSPDVEQALEVWRAHQAPGPYLLPSPKPHRTHLFRSHINGLMNQYLAAAGVAKHYSPHCLRHTFATHLVNAGVSLEILKELMGHHSMQLTLRYAQLYDATKKHQYEQAMAQITRRQALGGR
jgi:integrase/recombinase XerD